MSDAARQRSAPAAAHSAEGDDAPARPSGSRPRVGLVLVSHSDALACGLRDLVAQMAPGVPIGMAGGTDDGGLGTSPDLVAEAVAAADTGAGVVLLYDLGSARMSAELATEFLDPAQTERVRIVDTAFVEGALAAGVAAAGGQSLDETAASALEAARGGTVEGAPEGSDGAAAVVRTVVLADPAGLHARPAARLVRALTGLAADARVAVPGGGVSAADSLTGLLRLAAPVGTAVTVSALGPDAEVAVRRITEALEVTAAGDTVEVATGGAHGAPVPAAPGRGVGPLHRPALAPVPVPDVASTGEAQERDRLDRALRQARDELTGGDIVAAHRALLEDPALIGAAYRQIAAGSSAPAAWSTAIGRARAELAAVADPVIASRAADVSDVGQRVLGVLTGHPARLSVPSGSVVLADDVPPSLVSSLAAQGVVGFVLRAGGARSHAAVLARSAGVPMVVAAGDMLDGVTDGTLVAVDGTSGAVRTDPPEDTTTAAAVPVPVNVPAGPVRRPDGGPLRLAANVGSVADARTAAAGGAEGVGLLRTELLFTGRSRLPDEAEQLAWLTGILEECPPGPVVVRTVDLGGDKPVPGLRLDPVRHGFLGGRGLRLCLARPELFRTHLRAVLRAGAVRPVELMFPFVTEPDEVRAARQALNSAVDSLRAEGVDHAAPSAVGMMVEIPTAVVDVRPFLPLVDFLSVGSNDLAQYLSASDRTLGEVANLYRVGERLVPGLVERLVAVAGPAGVPVAVCGDLAGDPEYAPALVAAGVTELSVAPPLVARLRAELLSRTPGQPTG